MTDLVLIAGIATIAVWIKATDRVTADGKGALAALLVVTTIGILVRRWLGSP